MSNHAELHVRKTQGNNEPTLRVTLEHKDTVDAELPSTLFLHDAQMIDDYDAIMQQNTVGLTQDTGIIYTINDVSPTLIQAMTDYSSALDVRNGDHDLVGVDEIIEILHDLVEQGISGLVSEKLSEHRAVLEDSEKHAQEFVDDLHSKWNPEYDSGEND